MSKERVRWTVVVTRAGLLVRRRQGPMVNVPWRDPRIASLECAVSDGELLVRIDASVFRSGSSGTVEVRVGCADPELINTMRRSR